MKKKLNLVLAMLIALFVVTPWASESASADITVPKGFVAEVFAENLGPVEDFAFDDTGILWVGSGYTGKVTRIEFDENTSLPIDGSTLSPAITGLDAVFGLAFDQEGNLFLPEFQSGKVARINASLLEGPFPIDASLIPPFAGAMLIADSVAEFSGTQGQDNWYYGYYDGDGPEPYSNADFEELPNYGTLTEGQHRDMPPHWYIDNAMFWTALWDGGGHPNGSNTSGSSLPVEHWVCRRWVSEVSGSITITGKLADNHAGAGDGVVGHIIVDGVDIFTHVINDGDLAGVDYSVNATVTIGSVVDFAVAPSSSDWTDSTKFTAVITRLERLGAPDGAAFAPQGSPFGRNLFVGDVEEGGVFEIEPDTGSVIEFTPLFHGTEEVIFSSDGQTMFAISADGGKVYVSFGAVSFQVRLYRDDTHSIRLEGTMQPDKSPTVLASGFAFPDAIAQGPGNEFGRDLYVGDLHGNTLFRVNPTTGAMTTFGNLGPGFKGFEDIIFDQSGRMYILGFGRDGQIIRIIPKPATPKKHKKHQGD